MAFEKKTWADRVAEFINRRILTKEDGSTELVTVARSEGTISVEGDAFNAETMNDLEQRIADEFDSLNNDLEEANSNLKEVNESLSKKAPSDHSSDTTMYGGASTSEYGHVRLCNDYTLTEAAKPQIPLVPSQRAIFNLYTNFTSKISDKSKIIVEARTLTGNGGDWILVSNSNKKLISAQTVRDDTSFYVTGINKQSATGLYTLIFNENIEKDSKILVWLTWID